MTKHILCMIWGHRFSEWEYTAPDSCEQVRVCIRDGYKQSRKDQHQFGEWEYVTSDSCDQVRICKRDGHQERQKARHKFGEWEYTAPDSCEQVRVCIRDGYKERQTRHTYGRTETKDVESDRYKGTISRKYCGRCGMLLNTSKDPCPEWDYTDNR
jgi:ribulose bisphosphate carboxylase small subunit